MSKDLLELKTREQELYMPTAEELREFQNYNRICVIREIKNNAKKGYYGVTIEKELVNTAIEKELIEKGYEIKQYDEKWCNIKWGKNKNNAT